MSYKGCMAMYEHGIKLAKEEYLQWEKDKEGILAEIERLKNKENLTSAESSKLSTLRHQEHSYDSAERFIFSKDWLEEFINRSGLGVNIDAFREHILKCKKSNDEQVFTYNRGLK